MTESVIFTVPGIPRGKGRPIATTIHGRARVFTPQATVNAETTVAWLAKQAMNGSPPLRDVALMLRVTAYLPIPGSWSQKRQRSAERGELLPTVRPDFDNVVKLVADAIKGIVWRDDTQVVDAFVRKRYAREPRVEIEVSPVATEA